MSDEVLNCKCGDKKCDNDLYITDYNSSTNLVRLAITSYVDELVVEVDIDDLISILETKKEVESQNLLKGE